MNSVVRARSQPAWFLDPAGWIERHPLAALWIAAFCLCVSMILIIRMWFLHRRTNIGKKILWTFILLVPLFGWLLYAGFFSIPDTSDIPLTRWSDF